MFIEAFAPMVAKFVLIFFPFLHHFIVVVVGFLTVIRTGEGFMLTYFDFWAFIRRWGTHHTVGSENQK